MTATNPPEIITGIRYAATISQMAVIVAKMLAALLMILLGIFRGRGPDAGTGAGAEQPCPPA